MTIATILFLRAHYTDTAKIEAAVLAAIADDYQPYGPPLFAGDEIVQAMVTGTAPGSIEEAQADIAALEARNTVTAYTADGAVSIGTGLKVLSKVSAAAMTLAAPAANGVEMDIIAGTAFAHVVTATGLIDDGVTGGAKNTITLGAFVGACVTLKAYNGHWVLKSKTVATIAA